MLLIFNDVIAPATCTRLLDEHDTNPDKRLSDPRDQSFNNRVLFLQRMTVAMQQTAAQLALEIGDVIGRHFRTELYPETVSVVRWAPGDEMALHCDGHTDHTQNRTHAVLIYLNDQEAGGEIWFPALGTVIAPRTGLMIAYDKQVLHGVRKVQQPRYTLTLWYSDNPAHALFSVERELDRP